MSASRTPLGARLAAGGSALLVASLWMPWYQISFPESFRESLRALGGSAAPTTGSAQAPGLAGALSGVMAGVASAIPDKITVTGWHSLKTADVILAIVGGLALLLLSGGLGVVSVDADRRSQALKTLGLFAVALVGYHIVMRPFGELPGFVEKPQLKFGIFSAFAGAIMLGAGGHLMGQEPQAAWTTIDQRDLAPSASAATGLEATETVTPTPEPPAAGLSVAPPAF